MQFVIRLFLCSFLLVALSTILLYTIVWTTTLYLEIPDSYKLPDTTSFQSFLVRWSCALLGEIDTSPFAAGLPLVHYFYTSPYLLRFAAFDFLSSSSSFLISPCTMILLSVLSILENCSKLDTPMHALHLHVLLILLSKSIMLSAWSTAVATDHLRPELVCTPTHRNLSPEGSLNATTCLNLATLNSSITDDNDNCSGDVLM